MDKYLLMLICGHVNDINQIQKCQEVVRQTITQVQIYQTIKEKEKKARVLAEQTLTKPGFWALTTGISSVTTKTLYLSLHNIHGIDSVNLKAGKNSSAEITISF